MYKASSAATWSFIGILFPIIGIIVALNAFSHLKHFIPIDDQEMQEKVRINKKAFRGMVTSVVLLFVSIFFFAVIVQTIENFPKYYEQNMQQQSSGS